MVVVAIVGILSAVALPRFLGVRDSAESGSVVGSMVGLAKECATGQLLGRTTTTNASAGADIDVTGTCNGLGESTLANATPFEAGAAEGQPCIDAVGGADSVTCTIKIDTNGGMSGEWTAAAP